MKFHLAGGVVIPSQTHSAAQVQFPLAGIWPPTERQWRANFFYIYKYKYIYIYLLLNDEDFFSIDFHILLEKELHNQKL